MVLPDTNERRTVEIDVVSELMVPEPNQTMTPESSMEADVAIEGPAWTPLVATEPASDAPEDLLSIMSGPTQVEEVTFDPRIADVMARSPRTPDGPWPSMVCHRRSGRSRSPGVRGDG